MQKLTKICLIISCLFYSCQSEDDASAPDLETRIERLNTEINQIIEESTGETSDDCRTTFIPGGNGCGPIFVYGVVGIDTVELEQLFEELSEAQTALYNLEGGPVCDLEFPSKDSLINGTCKACYGSKGNYECP